MSKISKYVRDGRTWGSGLHHTCDVTHLVVFVDEQDLAARALQQRLRVSHNLVDETRYVLLLFEDESRQVEQELKLPQIASITN